jgi:hypothetical protein
MVIGDFCADYLCFIYVHYNTPSINRPAANFAYDLLPILEERSSED